MQSDSRSPVLIRPLLDADFGAVAALFRALSLEFIVHDNAPESAAMFLRENDEAALRRHAGAGTHVFHVAEEGGLVVGYVALRARSHLFHLFVAKTHHGRGIARRLWDAARAAARAAGHAGGFTVNASNHALSVYLAFGFVPSAPLQCTKGIEYTPMALLAGAP